MRLTAVHPDDAGDDTQPAEAPDHRTPRALLIVLFVLLVLLCLIGVSAIDAAAANGLFGPSVGGCGGG